MAFGFALATFAGFWACVGDEPSSDSANDASSGGDGTTTGSDGSTGGDGSSTTDSGIVCDPGLTACGTSCVALQASDGNNCGRCGHSCQGDGCTVGHCNSVDLNAALTSATTVATTDKTDQVVVNMAPKLYRIPKAGGAATALWTGTDVTTYNNGSLTITSDNLGNERVCAVASSSAANPGYTYIDIGATPPANPVCYNERAGVTLGSLLASDDEAVGGDVAIQSTTVVLGCPKGICNTVSPIYATGGAYYAVAVQHGTPGSVLWTDASANIQSCARGSADAGTCTPTPLLSSAPGDAAPTKYLAVTSTKVFWVVTGSTHFRVLSCPFPGPCTSAKVLVDNEQTMDGFAADDDGIYWTIKDTGALRECRDTVNGCGTSSEDLLTGLTSPTSIAMDSKFVFVVQSTAGKLTRIAR